MDPPGDEVRSGLDRGGLDREGGRGGGRRGGRRDGRLGRPFPGPVRVPPGALHPLPHGREARHPQTLCLVLPILPGAAVGRPAGGRREARAPRRTEGVAATGRASG